MRWCGCMALRQCKLVAACRNDSQWKLLQTLNPKILVIQHDIQRLPPNQERNFKKILRQVARVFRLLAAAKQQRRVVSTCGLYSSPHGTLAQLTANKQYWSFLIFCLLLDSRSLSVTQKPQKPIQCSQPTRPNRHVREKPIKSQLLPLQPLFVKCHVKHA